MNEKQLDFKILNEFGDHQIRDDIFDDESPREDIPTSLTINDEIIYMPEKQAAVEAMDDELETSFEVRSPEENIKASLQHKFDANLGSFKDDEEDFVADIIDAVQKVTITDINEFVETLKSRMHSAEENAEILESSIPTLIDPEITFEANNVNEYFKNLND